MSDCIILVVEIVSKKQTTRRLGAADVTTTTAVFCSFVCNNRRKLLVKVSSDDDRPVGCPVSWNKSGDLDQLMSCVSLVIIQTCMYLSNVFICMQLLILNSY